MSSTFSQSTPTSLCFDWHLLPIPNSHVVVLTSLPNPIPRNSETLYGLLFGTSISKLKQKPFTKPTFWRFSEGSSFFPLSINYSLFYSQHLIRKFEFSQAVVTTLFLFLNQDVSKNMLMTCLVFLHLCDCIKILICRLYS